MPLEEGISLAIQALHSAMKRDSASGGDMQVVVIKEEKYEEVGEEKIKELRSAFN